VQYRRALDTSVFLGPWAYVDHLVLPPGTSTGPHLHRGVAEFYYVMNGQGTVTIGAPGPGRGGASASETAPIQAGDAVPIQLGEVHSFENTGSAALEFLIVGVAVDAGRRVDTTDALSLFPRGGRGN